MLEHLGSDEVPRAWRVPRLSKRRLLRGSHQAEISDDVCGVQPERIVRFEVAVGDSKWRLSDVCQSGSDLRDGCSPLPVERDSHRSTHINACRDWHGRATGRPPASWRVWEVIVEHLQDARMVAETPKDFHFSDEALVAFLCGSTCANDLERHITRSASARPPHRCVSSATKFLDEFPSIYGRSNTSVLADGSRDTPLGS